MLALLAAGVASTALSDDKQLADNSDMEKGGGGNLWPDGWGRVAEGGTWEEEDGNRFIRISSMDPGKMVMMYHEVMIPKGIKEIEIAWKQRITDLKKGAQPWFDARLMLEFTDSDRKAQLGKPKAPNFGKDTKGWKEEKLKVEVPEGASILKFMPTLFQVESGKYDLDDIVILGKE